jgi:hypothetical protein
MTLLTIADPSIAIGFGAGAESGARWASRWSAASFDIPHSSSSPSSTLSSASLGQQENGNALKIQH